MNRYTRVKVLGKGSFGSAILCRPKDNPNDQCVIKEINLGGYSSGQRREALNEIKVLQALQHPNIVSYRDSFEEGKKLYIVMEYASGGDLYKYMKRHPGGIGEDQALDFFVQICLALKHMHDRKILHRDLKTMNIFLGKDNMVKLGDFGISRVMRNTMEMARTKCGTPYYFSPELCQGRGYNNKTDVWSLGVVLYELATGRTPFDANNMNALIAKIIRGTYPALSSRHSSQMKQLVADCFQREPRNRPSINQILKKEYIRNRIAKFLDEKLHQEEFSHTVLHGQHFDKARPVAGPSSRPSAAPVARPAPGSAAVPAGVAPGGAGVPARPGMVQMNRPISAERRNGANIPAAGKPSGLAPAGKPSNAAAAVAAPFAGAAAGRMPRAYLLGNQQNKELANNLKKDYKYNFGANRAEELRKLADNLKNKNKDPNAKPAGDVHAEIYAAKKARDEQREKEREKERREREREFREREQKYRERKDREDRERRRREEEAAAKLEREREERRQREKAERERRRKDEKERELQREREAAERQRQRVQRDLEEAAKRDEERRRELQRIKEARERRIEEERRQREEQRKIEMERKARERKEELERKRIEEERKAQDRARAEREAADRQRMLEKWNKVSTNDVDDSEAPMPQKPYPAAKEDWQGMLANQMAGMQKMLNNHKDKHPTLRKPMEDDSFLASMLPKPAYDDNQYRAEPSAAKRSPKSEVVAAPSNAPSRDREARVVGAEKKSPAQPVFEVKKPRELPAKKVPVSPAAKDDAATKKALQDRKETRERERAKFKEWVEQQKKLGGADSTEQDEKMVVHTPGGAVELEAAEPIDEAALEAANERRHQAEFSYMLGDLITIVEESDSNPSTPSDENFGDSDEEDSAENDEDSDSPVEEPVVKENLDHNSMTQALFTGMLTIGKKNKFKLDAVSRKDSLFHRIEALRQYLETELGDDAMIDAYRLAKNATENDDDDAITEKMAKRMGEKNRGLIPHVYQLLVLEEIFERS